MKLDSDEIREAADTLLKGTLKEIFTNDSLKISISDFNTQSDRGIDYVFEIIERSTKITKLKFNTQNKGIEEHENLNLLKTNRFGPKGYISFKLDKVRHVPYYMSEIAEPVIIFICDIQCEKVYWYPIQLDAEIEERAKIKLSKRTSSIQIYVDPKNELNFENRNRFLDDIIQSKIDQNIKYNYKSQLSKHVSDTFKNAKDDKDLTTSIIRAIDSFGKFHLVPKYLIAQQYPFSQSENNLGYCSHSTLYTTNTSVIDFFQRLKERRTEGAVLSDAEIVILKFLNQNFIYHVNQVDTYKNKQVCIHDLLDKASCSCIRCSYRKFDYENIIGLLKNVNQNLESEEEVRKRIYVQYRLGLYDDVISSLYELYEDARKKKAWDLYYLCSYNLKKLKKISWLHDYKEDNEKLREQVDKIIVDKDFDIARHKVNSDLAEAIKWVHENKFYNRALYKITDLSRQILNKVHLDQRGGWTTDNKERELILEFAHFISFIESNPVFYDRFTDFDHIINIVFESIIAPNLITRNDTSKETSIDPFILNRVMRYGKSDKLLSTLRNYNVTQVDIVNDDKNVELITETVVNFSKSLKKVSRLLKQKNNKVNFHFQDEIRTLVQNSLLFFSYLNIKQEYAQIFMDKCAIKFLIYKDTNWDKKYFNHFIWKKGDLLSSKSLQIILTKTNEDQDLHRAINVVQIIGKLKKRSIDIDKIISVEMTLERLFKLKNEDSDLKMLINAHEYFDLKNKNRIEKIIINNLNKKFSGEIYYRAVMNSIINYDQFFEQFVMTVPKSDRESSFKEMMTGEKDEFNIRLNWLVQICYKFDLEVPEEISAPSLYYKWLFEPESFDYSKFNPIWLLDYKVKDFVTKFKTIPKIKNEVEKYLSEHIQRDLTSFYFNELVK